MGWSNICRSGIESHQFTNRIFMGKTTILLTGTFGNVGFEVLRRFLMEGQNLPK